MTMKTQINNLQRGHGRQGIAGTSMEQRRQVAAKVREENPDGMTVRVKNQEYRMTLHTSMSGKTFWYTSEQLTTEQVRDILPGDTKAIEHPELVSVTFVINGDMTCEYQTSRRVKTTRQWKQGQTIEVAEKDVTIL